MPITKGKLKQPWFCCLYGTPGIGKTTLAAQAPKPLFVDFEDGTNHIEVDRIHAEGTISEAIKEAYDSEGYETLVIDSLSSLEQKHQTEMCQAKGWPSIDHLDYSQGLKQWRQAFLEYIDKISSKFRAKGMNVLIIAHSKDKEMTDPVSQAKYNKLVIDAEKEISGKLIGKLDGCFLLKHEMAVTKKKAIGDGSRLVYTKDEPQYMAKTRWAIEDPVEPSQLFNMLK